MIVRPATPDDIRATLFALDPECEVEHLARSFTGDIADTVTLLVTSLPHWFSLNALFTDAGARLGLLGASLHSPGVVALYGCTTTAIAEGQNRHAWLLFATRWLFRSVLPGVRVAQMTVLATRGEWLATLYRLGFQAQGEPLPLGAGGERFQELAWLNPRLVDGVLPPVGSAQAIRGASHV